MKITIKLGSQTLHGTLAENATARHFASLLPLELTLEDYASTEKISDLPEKLTTEGAPKGSTPSAGSIAYYAPWGNLALFYGSAPYAPGLVLMGTLDSGVELLQARSRLKATLAPAE